MYAEESRHALLFEPGSSQNSPRPKHERNTWQPIPDEPLLFPETPVAVAPQPPVCTADPVGDTAGALQRNNGQQRLRPPRHVTLFASIAVAPPCLGLRDQAQCASSLPLASSVHFCGPAQLPQAQQGPPFSAHTAPPIPSRLRGAPSSTASYPQRVICGEDGSQRFPAQHRQQQQQQHQALAGQTEVVSSLPPPLRPCCLSCSPACSCAFAVKAEDLASSLKSVEGCIACGGLGDVDAQRFVARELKEIHQMIQARAHRLRQQEEEAATSAAKARNELRLHAQQLLNQAAEKLERVASQQRRRTEAAADEAAAVMRRAVDAQRLLRQERCLLKQLQDKRHDEQQQKLSAATAALQEERRRCLDLEGRLHVVQQENRRLHVLLHARGPLDPIPHSELPMTSVEAASLLRAKQSAPAQRPTAARTTRGPHVWQARPCQRATFATAAAANTASAATHGGTLPPTVGRVGAPPGGVSGMISAPSTLRGDTVMGRRAMVDVQVSLPPVGPCAVGFACPSSTDPHTHTTQASREPGPSEEQSTHVLHQDSVQPGPVLGSGESHKSVPCQKETEAPQGGSRMRLEAGSAPRSDESVYDRGGHRRHYSSSWSRSSSSSSVVVVRRRGSRKVMGRTPRSASRGSISTRSTSSSRAMSQRQAEGPRSRSSNHNGTLRQQRISFSIPEMDRRQPHLKGGTTSSSGSASPARKAGGGQRLALRGDVAGRLQASLERLQERQMLQGKIQQLAEQLLHPQRSKALP